MIYRASLTWMILFWGIVAEQNSSADSTLSDLRDGSNERETTRHNVQSIKNENDDDNFRRSKGCKLTQNLTDIVFDCSHMGLSYFNQSWVWPNTTVLDVSFNHFVSSESLKIRSLDKLRVLRFSHNSKLNVTTQDAFEGMKNLQSLDMSYSKLKGIGKFAFGSLKNLTTLDLSHNNDLKVISSFAFHGLENLKTLDMSNPAKSMKLSEVALKPLRKLNSLRINNWNLKDVISLRLFPLCSLNESSLATLNLEAVNRGGASGVFWNLVPPLFYCFGNTRIRHLKMSKNQIITIHSGVLRNIKYLITLDLSDNLIIGGDATVLIDLALMHDLTKLYLARQNYGTVNFGPHRKLKWSKNLMEFNKLKRNSSVIEIMGKTRIFALPPKLKTIEGGYFRFVVDISIADTLRGNPNNSLEYLNLEHTMLEQPYNGIFGYFPKLWYLNLQYSDARITNPAVFQNLSSLKYLLAGGCYLDYNLPDDKAWKRLINSTKLVHLLTLDIADNNLRYIPKNAFKNFQNIIHLNVSKNQLEQVNFTISHLSRLQHLNLSDNRLSSLGNLNLRDLHKVTNKSYLEIDVTGNKFICLCSDIQTLQFVSNLGIRFIGFTCKFSPDKTITNLSSIDVQELYYYCGVDWFTTHWRDVFLIYCLILGLIALCSFIYRDRRRFLYLWYLSRFVTEKNKTSNCVTHFIFDAFIDYHPEDLSFIQQLILQLEDKYRYVLCLEDRNFGLGIPVTRNVAEACRYSVTMVILLSRKNLERGGLKSTLHFIQEQHDQRKAKVILIFLEPPSRFKGQFHMPATLEYLMSCNTVLNWSRRAQDRALFWLKLRLALGYPLKTKEQVDQLTHQETVLYYHANGW